MSVNDIEQKDHELADGIAEVGAKCKVAVTQDGKTYTWPLAFTTSAGVTDKPSDKQDQKLVPFNPTGGGAKVLANAACDLVVTALKLDTTEFPGGNDVVKPKAKKRGNRTHEAKREARDGKAERQRKRVRKGLPGKQVSCEDDARHAPGVCVRL